VQAKADRIPKVSTGPRLNMGKYVASLTMGRFYWKGTLWLIGSMVICVLPRVVAGGAYQPPWHIPLAQPRTV